MRNRFAWYNWCPPVSVFDHWMRNKKTDIPTEFGHIWVLCCYLYVTAIDLRWYGDGSFRRWYRSVLSKTTMSVAKLVFRLWYISRLWHRVTMMRRLFKLNTKFGVVTLQQFPYGCKCCGTVAMSNVLHSIATDSLYCPCGADENMLELYQ